VSRDAHPARSLDFLSRLHDGELTPSERAHFESHRSHCDECRRAAADFEATLDYYRTAGTASPKPDLAARILRRLESSSPRRRPFGVVFGIDLKWAGAFTAALVVTLLGYSLVEREKEHRQIRVSFPSAPAPPKLVAAAPPAPTAPAPQEPATRPEPKVRDSKTESLMAKDQATSRPAPGPKPTAAANAVALSDAVAAEAQLEAKSPTPLSSTVAQAAAVPAPRPTKLSAKASSAGGESGVSADKSRRARSEAEMETVAVAGAAPATTPAIRLVVSEVDGWGTPPKILNDSEIDLGTEDRGRYLVVIASNGTPIEIRREEGRRDAREFASANPTALEILRKLRFTAGDRPRRLLVIVE
jgi:hypothetical protein